MAGLALLPGDGEKRGTEHNGAEGPEEPPKRIVSWSQKRRGRALPGWSVAHVIVGC
jgi:hypothetical protein